MESQSKRLKDHAITKQEFYDLLVEVKEKPLGKARTFVDDINTAYHTYSEFMFLSDKQLIFLKKLHQSS